MRADNLRCEVQHIFSHNVSSLRSGEPNTVPATRMQSLKGDFRIKVVVKSIIGPPCPATLEAITNKMLGGHCMQQAKAQHRRRERQLRPATARRGLDQA